MLGFRDRLRLRKKQPEKKETGKAAATTQTTPTEKSLTLLEQICGNDKETYRALFNVMFLDPRKSGTTMKEAAENAKKFEKAKDNVRAKVWYEIAGSMAIYEGDPKKVVEYFGEAEKIPPKTDYPILRVPEKAVAKAQEYYKRYLEAQPESKS
jgi:hypothetical protein